MASNLPPPLLNLPLPFLPYLPNLALPFGFGFEHRRQKIRARCKIVNTVPKVFHEELAELGGRDALHCGIRLERAVVDLKIVGYLAECRGYMLEGLSQRVRIPRVPDKYVERRVLRPCVRQPDEGGFRVGHAEVSRGVVKVTTRVGMSPTHQPLSSPRNEQQPVHLTLGSLQSQKRAAVDASRLVQACLAKT